MNLEIYSNIIKELDEEILTNDKLIKEYDYKARLANCSKRDYRVKVRTSLSFIPFMPIMLVLSFLVRGLGITSSATISTLSTGCVLLSLEIGKIIHNKLDKKTNVKEAIKNNLSSIC